MSSPLDDEIREVLRDYGPLNSSEIADQLCVPDFDVRERLHEMQDQDRVVRYPGGCFDYRG